MSINKNAQQRSLDRWAGACIHTDALATRSKCFVASSTNLCCGHALDLQARFHATTAPIPTLHSKALGHQRFPHTVVAHGCKVRLQKRKKGGNNRHRGRMRHVSASGQSRDSASGVHDTCLVKAKQVKKKKGVAGKQRSPGLPTSQPVHKSEDSASGVHDAHLFKAKQVWSVVDPSPSCRPRPTVIPVRAATASVSKRVRVTPKHLPDYFHRSGRSGLPTTVPIATAYTCGGRKTVSPSMRPKQIALITGPPPSQMALSIHLFIRVYGEEVRITKRGIPPWPVIG